MSGRRGCRRSGSVVQAAIGVLFIVMALHPDARFAGAMPGRKRPPGPPFTPIARVLFCLGGDYIDRRRDQVVGGPRSGTPVSLISLRSANRSDARNPVV